MMPQRIALALCALTGAAIFGCASDQPRADDDAIAQPIAPSDAATFNVAVAQDYDQAQHYREAIVHYERALRLDPDHHPTVHRRLARLYALIDEPQRARESYRQALRLDPNDPTLLADAGAFELAQGRPAEAEMLLRRALDIDPAYAGAWIRLGAALGAQQQYPDALEAYGRAMDPAEARANVALAMARNADFNAAREQMSIAMRSRPDLQRYNGILEAMRAEHDVVEGDDW